MSSLTTLDKRCLEDVFGMGSGYVLDFTNDTFAEFFRENAGADIYADKFATNGNSKARRLRAFWEIEPDAKVGHVIEQLLAVWQYDNPAPDAAKAAKADACKKIASRLLGRQVAQETTEVEFLRRDFRDVSLAKVELDGSLLPILESRLAEAKRCLQNDAPLAVLFLCGSILEGLLLSVACTNPKHFNQAKNSPKDQSGKVKQFADWRLVELIDVAYEAGYLKLDVRKFSHELRDFRNYIHPYQQMREQFSPDKHTAEMCLQVLKAAIASLSGERT